MTDSTDVVDMIRARLAELYPGLDTRAFGITGRILRLAELIESRRAEYLNTFQLTPGEFDVLATVRRLDTGHGVNPGGLLDSLLITSGGLTKRLDRLEDDGLIERHPDPDDRRGTLIRLSSDGLDHIDRVLPGLLEMETQVVSTTFSDLQLEQVSSLLRRLDASQRAPQTPKGINT